MSYREIQHVVWSVVASLALLVSSGNAVRAEEIKVLIENAKVRVIEVTFKPGEVSKNIDRPYRVVRALTDGTLERTSLDGKKETVEWKAGDVKEYGPDNYGVKNLRSTEFRVYVVVPK